VFVLENLTPAAKVTAPKDWRPAVEFQNGIGEATTPGYASDEQPDFEKFLIEAGFDPNKYQIVGEPRTSRWQVARPFPLEPQWLTAYRFKFVQKNVQEIDLPLTWSLAKKNKKPLQVQETGKALVVAVADLQIGKTDYRGNTQQLLERMFLAYDALEKKLKQGKYERVVLVDVGDIVEGFANKADMQQLATNDLSIMGQVDTAIALIWELVTRTVKHCPNVTYATIASNHCQNRVNKQQVGQPGADDWGVMIAKQIHRLAKATDTPLKVLIPEPHDESLAVDVFDDGFHILGIWHGHQSNNPNTVPDWWSRQAFGHQPITAATIGLTGHFHHLRVQELGQASNGGSRYWIQASTMDNGSNWYRLNAGSDSTVGITHFELHRNTPYTGTIGKF
jgi:hypothetical protein